MMPTLRLLGGMNNAMASASALKALARLEKFKDAKPEPVRLGRPVKLRACPTCKGKMSARELLRHQANCDGTPPVIEDKKPKRKGNRITTTELARILDVSRETLRLWRLRNFGPPVMDEDGKISYITKEVETFLRKLSDGSAG